jgi:ABC-type glycerol-3-phosphate transport system permease component
MKEKGGVKYLRGLSCTVRYIVMVFSVLLALFPLYFVIVTAFKSRAEFIFNKIGIPITWVLSNFHEVVLTNPLHRWIINSVILTIPSVLVSLLVASLAAYAISKMYFKIRDVAYNSIIPLMVLPPVVLLIPLLRAAIDLKLVNTFIAPIVIYTGILLPFSIYMLTNYFATVSNEIIDSAKIDGLSDLRILFRIMMPLSKPAILILIVINSLYVWNELLIALIFLQTNKTRPLMVGIVSLKDRYSTNTTVLMAGLLISAIPIIVLFVISQKHFVKGLSAGAVKG